MGSVSCARDGDGGIWLGLELHACFDATPSVSLDVLASTFAEMAAGADLKTYALVRGIEGFGSALDNGVSMRQPMVAVAVGERSRIQALASEFGGLLPGGVLTTDRIWVSEAPLEDDDLQIDLEWVKLTIYCGRGDCDEDGAAFLRVIDHLQVCGVASATAFLALDGTVLGRRRRDVSRLRNRGVPLVIVAVGRGEAVGRALPGVIGLVGSPVLTLEDIHVLKQGSGLSTLPQNLGCGGRRAGMRAVTIQTACGGRPQVESILHHQLISDLRRVGAAGATSVRGIWGYTSPFTAGANGGWSRASSNPIVSFVIDQDEHMRTLWKVLDASTCGGGLITSETASTHRPV